MQFLCQLRAKTNPIRFTFQLPILHRDCDKLAAKAHSGAQMQKIKQPSFGAILHQNGSELFSHQFWACLKSKWQ